MFRNCKIQHRTEQCQGKTIIGLRSDKNCCKFVKALCHKIEIKILLKVKIDIFSRDLCFFLLIFVALWKVN